MKKGKKGKSKFLALFGIGLIVLLVTSVIITAGENDNAETKKEIQENIQEKMDNTVPEGALSYVEDFVEEKGISSNSINNITEVDFNDLPKEVSIENVDDTNLAIYQVNYNQSAQKQDNLFVITYSVEKLKSQGDLIISQDKREFLNFGFSEAMKGSGFLKTAAGVEGSLEKGYVMMRDGSITGISSNLEILEGTGEVEIVIYKNGKPIQFGNSFVADSTGIKKDYDVQSKDTVVFQAGDVISLYARASEGITWKDAISLVEIIS